jgi:hypothetical protein
MSTPEVVPEAQPAPALAGTFAIYEDGQGGFVLVTDTGTGPDRKHIPGGLIKMVMKTGALGKLFGMG